MNIMNLPAGPGWSPDGGKFWVKDNLVYWSDGDITDMNNGGVFRTMPGNYTHEENYSEWSDEKRAEVKAKFKAERDEAAAEEAKEDAEQEALCRTAKTKLTKEEYEAVHAAGSYCDCGRFFWGELT